MNGDLVYSIVILLVALSVVTFTWFFAGILLRLRYKGHAHIADANELTPIQAVPRARGVAILTPPPIPGEITPPPPLPLPFVAWLELLHPAPPAGQPHSWHLSGKVALGYDPKLCNLVLPRTEALSRRHADIEIHSDKCVLVNKNRYGNTRVNGRRLAEDEETELSHDAYIELDTVRLRFGQIGLPVLEVSSGNLRGKRISGREPPIFIGEAGDLEIPDCDLRIVIVFDPSKAAYVVQNEGKGEFKLNGVLVGDERKLLHPGDILELDETAIVFSIGLVKDADSNKSG